MSNQTLPERLRHIADWWTRVPDERRLQSVQDLLREAADALERLTAERDEARRYAAGSEANWVNGVRPGNTQKQAEARERAAFEAGFDKGQFGAMYDLKIRAQQCEDAFARYRERQPEQP